MKINEVKELQKELKNINTRLARRLRSNNLRNNLNDRRLEIEKQLKEA